MGGSCLDLIKLYVDGDDAAMAEWGLCKDEFKDNTLSPHWPPALYHTFGLLSLSFR